MVKFGMIAGARNVVFVHTKCSRRPRLRTDRSIYGRIMVESDHSRIGRLVNHELLSNTFAAYFGSQFFVAGTIFGNLGG